MNIYNAELSYFRSVGLTKHATVSNIIATDLADAAAKAVSFVSAKVDGWEEANGDNTAARITSAMNVTEH